MPSLEYRATISRMAGEKVSTVTPYCRTISGSMGTAACTLLFTFTWAMSGAVPTAKVTEICMAPRDELTELM